MGVVYVAQDRRLGRRVALKTLKAADHREARDRLWREARAAASLNHPGICQVYGVEEVDGELWLAMELLDGRGLDSQLQTERPGVERAVDIGLEILVPLGFLHGRGLVHRDLKPSNIFLTSRGITLLDFGLARPVDVSDDGTQLTRTGTILGSPRYMAPEQWRAGDVGARSDLFSCGAILYEMLSGRYAFDGENPIEIFHACVYEQPPPLTGPAGIEAIDGVVRRALAKDPSERYGSAEEMADALRAALARMRSMSTTGRETDGAGTVARSGGDGGAGSKRAPVETIQRFIALPFRVLRPDPEIDFLATSLPEAISTSLSGLRHLVVRSTQLAATSTARDGAGEFDLKRLASEAEVDYALSGHLMASGSRVRLNAQLLQVPAGTVVWSLQEDAPIGDLLQLHDDLTSKIVQGVAIPLSPAEERRLRSDVPRSAQGYELYLRALHLIPDIMTTPDLLAVRDLLRSSVEYDPDYAPAWAQLARACRVLAKYHLADPEEHLALTRDAFDHAFACNPDSPLVHYLYTYYQLEELADSQGAMLRLLGRVSEGTADANLWAGLVPACRFLGLYEASLAAHERARGLDPRIETSVEHTYFQIGEYDEVGRYGQDPLLTAAVRGARGDTAGAIAALTEPGDRVFEGMQEFFIGAGLAALEGRTEECERHTRAAVDRGIADPEAIFFFTRVAGRAGLVDLCLDLCDRMVDRGFYSVSVFEREPWLESVRGDARFSRVQERARRGHLAGLKAFREAGGEKLLGVTEG